MYTSQVDKIDKIQEIVDNCIYNQSWGKDSFRIAIFEINAVLGEAIVTFP